MLIIVRFFARMRELVGSESITLTIRPGTTVRELRLRLNGQYPAAAELLRKCAIGLNGTFATDEAVIDSGAEVSILPPVSGGQA